MRTIAWRVRGLIVAEARIRDYDGVLEEAGTAEERISLKRLVALTGISAPTFSRTFTGECDRRSSRPWQPDERFYEGLRKWLGHKHTIETRLRIAEAREFPEFSECKIGDLS